MNMLKIHKKKVLVGVIFLSLFAALLLILSDFTKESSAPPEKEMQLTTIASNLEIPWALDLLPDGSILFTERPGRVRMIDKEEVLA